VGWDPGTYGRSFADVYDDWYGVRGDEAAVVEHLGAAVGRCGRVVELGVGTGRLAIPLARAGWEVVGVDSSPEMLAILGRNATLAGVRVDARLHVVGDGAELPEADVVLAAYNFVFNLPDRRTQRAGFAEAIAAAPVLVVEAFVPDPGLASGERDVVLPSGVAVRTNTDHRTGVVEGCHRGPDGVERPWRICVATPDELDELAVSSGWVLDERDEDWSGTAFDAATSPQHVSVYRRAALNP